MIILDTNVIMAFLLSDGITRKIVENAAADFASPEYCFRELWNHRSRWNKNRLSDNELQQLIVDLQHLFVQPIKTKVYSEMIPLAGNLIRDEDDVLVLAAALSVDNEGFWTYNLRHFRLPEIEKMIRILTTAEVLRIYPLESE